MWCGGQSRPAEVGVRGGYIIPPSPYLLGGGAITERAELTLKGPREEETELLVGRSGAVVHSRPENWKGM